MSFTQVDTESTELESIWEERAKAIVFEDKSATPDKIKQLREIAKKHDDLVLPEDDEFYLKFLRGGNSDPEAAFEIIKSYFTLRKAHPRYFKGCLNIDEMTKTTYSQQIHAMLSHRDEHGRRIYVFRPGRWNPDKISFTELFCAGYMLCEMTAREERTQIAGFTALVDAQGFGWKQLRNVSMEDGRNLASFFNISFPVWLRKSHILNAPRVFNMLFNMLRPFLSATVRDEVVFHTGDISTSLKEYFRMDLIPKDLGGTAPILDNTPNTIELRKMSEFFVDLENYGYVKR